MRYAKLVMVTEQNNNRYIEMIQVDQDWFEVFTGRVDLTKISQGKKPMAKWDSYLKSKTRPSKKPMPYTDITISSSAENEPTLLKTVNNKAHLFLEWLQAESKGKVTNTYTISSSAVSLSQIEIVNDLLSELSKATAVDAANNILLRIYTYLPRQMGNVKQHLLTDLDELQRKIDEERDNVDTLSSQMVVSQNTDVDMTLAKAINVSIDEPLQDDIDKITSILGKRKLKEIYKVTSHATEDRFMANDNHKLLWHGSSVSNWISILRTGLKIYPSATNGRLYGNGIYFANNIQKSLSYGSTVLGLFEVAMGNIFTSTGRGISHWSQPPDGYHSLYVPGYHDEIVIFNEAQVNIKYIVKV